jgi:hypothetical protein
MVRTPSRGRILQKLDFSFILRGSIISSAHKPDLGDSCPLGMEWTGRRQGSVPLPFTHYPLFATRQALLKPMPGSGCFEESLLNRLLVANGIHRHDPNVHPTRKIVVLSVEQILLSSKFWKGCSSKLGIFSLFDAQEGFAHTR